VVKGELCRVITSDGIELQGLLVCPEGKPGTRTVIHVHGLAGNFYENRFIDDVATAVVENGINFLTVSTRGRDYLSDFIYERPDGTTEYKQIGGIHELFEESLLDIKAWVEFLASRGTEIFILQGHSHGALKVTYYSHKTRDSRVGGLILLSPSDDFGCQRSCMGERFDEALDVATALIADGKGAVLMPEGYFQYPVSAATYMDTFGQGSPLSMFNISRTDRDEFAELASIKVPVLAVAGNVEEAFVGVPEDYLSGIRGLCRNAASFESCIIDGAPHNYLHFEAQVAKRIGKWIAVHFGRPPGVG
jgi:pimeloyl-ACP methyl ester carboxylesterase